MHNIEHVESLNSIQNLKSLGFKGQDRDLSISLDYGLLWKRDGDQIIFVYKIGPNRFDRSTLSTTTDPKVEWHWIFESFGRRGDLQDYLSGMETTIEEFLENWSLGEQTQALMELHGHECIFGSPSWQGFEIEGYEPEE